MRRLCYVLLVIFFLTPFTARISSAQESGQFCVRAFEDRNANGVRDPDEVYIQTGLTANLQNEAGVVIATQRIEDSPTRTQGLICFRDLPDGQYGLFVTTLNYTATTADSFVTRIQTGQLPGLLEYGGQRIQQTEATPSTEVVIEETATDNGLQRILVAALGGLAAMVIVGVLGLGVYLVWTRSSRPRQDKTKPRVQPPPDPNAQFRPPEDTPKSTTRYDEFQDF